MSDKAETWLKSALGYEFNDVELLQQALTHRSALGESNERLEFLGDAVLDIVVSDELFRSQEDADEGDLSRLRSSIVKDKSLAELASDLGLGEYLVLGGGERKTGGHRRESILADALEAIFGAVYVDAGFDAARTVVMRALGDRLHDLPVAAELRDPKTRLQEWLQARKLSLPVYELAEVSGEDHKQRFSVTCSVNELSQTTQGEAASRRSAEQQAARHMLAILSGETP